MLLDNDKKIPASFGLRKYDCPNHWKEIDITKFEFDKPTVICFGGNRTFDSRGANSYCRMAEQLLRENIKLRHYDFSNIDFLGCAYGRFEHHDDVEISKLTDKEMQMLANLFYKRFCFNNEGQVDKQVAIKNFNKLTIFCHSYGSYAVDIIMNKLCNLMQDSILSYDDCKDILSQIICVSYAPRSIITGASTIQIISGCDGFGAPFNANKKLKNTYGNYFYNISDVELQKNGIEKTDENSLSVFTTNMTNDTKVNDHSIKVLMNVNNDQDKKYNKNAKSIFDIAQTALALSVINSIRNTIHSHFIPKPSLDDLYRVNKKILGENQINFDEPCY